MLYAITACTVEWPQQPEQTCAAAAFPLQHQSEYILPYPVGFSATVLQANCTDQRQTHHPLGPHPFAYDFSMDMGSPVVAARAGRVRHIVQHHPDFSGLAGDDNYIIIAHEDASFAKYAHLQQDGVLVALDQWVQQGEVIGLSGHSGRSSEPHLHFHVAIVSGETDCDVRTRDCRVLCGVTQLQCTTIPVNFVNTIFHERGLRANQSYPAQAFTPLYVYQFSE